MQTLSLPIGGMSCAHCVRAVREALEALPGLRVEQLAVGSATVVFDPQRVSAGQIARAIGDAGYTTEVAGS